MKLEGIHHVTAITADAQDNVDFYAGVLGLRLVKKTVNQDDPTVYHVFYSDEQGQAGSDITFFEFPGAPRGRAGDGMVHTIAWRVASPAALDFWEQRLGGAGIAVERADRSLSFEDPEGLRHELRVSDVSDEPLIAEHPEVPRGARAARLRRGPCLRLGSRGERAAAARARLRGGRGHLGGSRREPGRIRLLRRSAGGPGAAGRRDGASRRLGIDPGGA